MHRGTDSFHGVAFAVNFSKEFTAFKRFKDGAKNSQNTRIYSLLNSLELQNRISSNNLPDYLPDEKIDYGFVQEKLLNLRKKLKFSIDFLTIDIQVYCMKNFFQNPGWYMQSGFCCLQIERKPVK